MIHSQTEQYLWADRIMQAVCSVGGITFLDLISETKTTKTNELRGLYCLLTREYCIHPERAARLIARSRQNVINQARRYMQYIQAKDKVLTNLYNRIKNQINATNKDEKR